MTCIVAVKHDDKVTMVGDSAASNGHNIHPVGLSKVFNNREFSIGYTESFRLGNIMEFVWSPPEQTVNCSDDKYLYIHVVESIREAIRVHCPTVTSLGTYFLLAWKGRLFTYEGEGFLLEHKSYAAVGSGAETALGALFALHNSDGVTDPEIKCQLAVEAAAHHTTSVLPQTTKLTK